MCSNRVISEDRLSPSAARLGSPPLDQAHPHFVCHAVAQAPTEQRGGGSRWRTRWWGKRERRVKLTDTYIASASPRSGGCLNEPIPCATVCANSKEKKRKGFSLPCGKKIDISLILLRGIERTFAHHHHHHHPSLLTPSSRCYSRTVLSDQLPSQSPLPLSFAKSV